MLRILVRGKKNLSTQESRLKAKPAIKKNTTRVLCRLKNESNLTYLYKKQKTLFLYFFKRILFEIEDYKEQHKIMLDELAASITNKVESNNLLIQDITSVLKEKPNQECPYKDINKKEIDLTQLGIKAKDIENSQG